MKGSCSVRSNVPGLTQCSHSARYRRVAASPGKSHEVAGSHGPHEAAQIWCGGRSARRTSGRTEPTTGDSHSGVRPMTAARSSPPRPIAINAPTTAPAEVPTRCARLLKIDTMIRGQGQQDPRLERRTRRATGAQDEAESRPIEISELRQLVGPSSVSLIHFSETSCPRASRRRCWCAGRTGRRPSCLRALPRRDAIQSLEACDVTDVGRTTPLIRYRQVRVQT